MTVVPKHCRYLSLKLYEVLEDTGLSVENRDLKKATTTAEEILHTVVLNKDYSLRIFGSQMEGTYTLGMKSDHDQVCVLTDIPLICNISNPNPPNCLLLVQDSQTPAGYAKLQYVQDGMPLFGENVENHSILQQVESYGMLQSKLDRKNRLVCSFEFPDEAMDELERHGPALASTETVGPNASQSLDTVIGIYGNMWPECASEWLTRDRPYNWPSPEVIEECKALGFIVVPVGHPHSAEQDLLWRLSFSHQERNFVTQFNSTQYKCYVTLKLIKKDIILRIMQTESLSSYHCKTCMFYMIENTPASFWLPDNLLQCILSCLKLFQYGLKWVFAPIISFLPRTCLTDTFMG